MTTWAKVLAWIAAATVAVTAFGLALFLFFALWGLSKNGLGPD